ncbi:putative oxidoreductase - protein [Rosellinia necatrix]|uniref:Putative oxidoreductase-protein n=1 Tax=Rosellinia necatrix TaxID=77044 RepID=A0A1W2TRD0_ROSNE|nr:putative oxidoreductase - protein [Rosellinia necatrix]
MGAIQNVALAGATGNLGRPILEQLLKTEFQVTVLTRLGGKHSFPESVIVKEVDYESVESLTAAFQGQDAVVSAVAFAGVAGQINILNAAVKAGVKRLIPSEFGSDTLNPQTAALPVFADKVAMDKTIAKEAEKGTITYTSIITGPFFDWGFGAGLFLNAKEKTIQLYDGGDRHFSTTTLAGIGRAVVAVLRHPEETKNRAVRVQDIALTLNQLKDIAEKVTGTAWEGEVVDLEEEVLAPALAELKKEKPDPSKYIFPQLFASMFGNGYGGHFQNLDNAILGLPGLTEAEAEAVVAAALK